VVASIQIFPHKRTKVVIVLFFTLSVPLNIYFLTIAYKLLWYRKHYFGFFSLGGCKNKELL